MIEALTTKELAMKLAVAEAFEKAIKEQPDLVAKTYYEMNKTLVDNVNLGPGLLITCMTLYNGLTHAIDDNYVIEGVTNETLSRLATVIFQAFLDVCPNKMNDLFKLAGMLDERPSETLQ